MLKRFLKITGWSFKKAIKKIKKKFSQKKIKTRENKTMKNIQITQVNKHTYTQYETQKKIGTKYMTYISLQIRLNSMKPIVSY